MMHTASTLYALLIDFSTLYYTRKQTSPLVPANSPKSDAIAGVQGFFYAKVASAGWPAGYCTGIAYASEDSGL